MNHSAVIKINFPYLYLFITIQTMKLLPTKFAVPNSNLCSRKLIFSKRSQKGSMLQKRKEISKIQKLNTYRCSRMGRSQF